MPSCSWLSYVKRKLLSLTISSCSNVDEFLHQIKEMKNLRRIRIYDFNRATIDEMCTLYSRVLKVNQQPYLSLFVYNKNQVMRPGEEYIVASDDQWEKTFSKEKDGGTLVIGHCTSCGKR